MRAVALALAAAAAARAAHPAATEKAVVGDARLSLNGVWALTNGSAHISATVPGDLITDMQRAGLVGDPLYEFGMKGVAWDNATWVYSTTFTLPPALAALDFFTLVLDGVKMVADVALNGAALGFTSDQFLRYELNITASLLKAGANTLSISFPTGRDQRNVEERWMSCSGGWDWAPYSDTKSAGATTFSKGIWKSVYIVGVARASAAITHVAPRVFYKGAYPTAPLADGAHGDFSVDVVVHFAAPAATAGSLTVAGAWGATATVPVALPAGASNVTVTLAAADNAVKLWWPAQSPAGLTQNLYNLSVAFTEAGGAVAKADARRIGFRVFTLVTGNDTDPTTLAGKDGQTGFTMRFKVNGADIWSRGANMIPMEEMEGRSSAAAHRRLVQSAVEGGFNTFRLWGGGIFQWDAWYDACDELGIMIYHDMMFAQGNHAPAVTPTQTAEIAYQVRRLAAHPSVAIWDGCNECDGHGIYASFVMTAVAAEDPARPPWPSCPAHGWASGVDALWGLPNGSPLGLAPRAAPAPRAAAAARAGDACTFIAGEDYDTGSTGPLPHVPAASAAECCSLCAGYADKAKGACWAATFADGECWYKTKTQATTLAAAKPGVTGCWPAGHGPPPPLPSPTPAPPPGALKCASLEYETHGYYQHGEGFKTRNSQAALAPFDLNQPPKLGDAALTGPGVCSGTYASEFGAVEASSFESFAPTLAPADWGLNTPPMAERNYALDNFVVAVANLTWPDAFTATGEADFKAKLYFAQLASALWLKSDVEARRSQNSWGCVVWQFNEIWPTGGWGSIEYGTVGFTPGQVEGGRWKPTQYFYKRFVYNDLLISASSDGRVLVKSDDAFAPFAGTAAVSLLHLATGARAPLSSFAVSLPRGGGQTAWSCVNASVDFHTVACPMWPDLLAGAGCAPDGSDCVAMLALTRADGSLAAENFELLAPPFRLALPAARVSFAIGAAAADGSVPITLTADKTALFVTLTTLAQGRFSDNAFIMAPGATTVDFLPWEGFDAALLASSLRVEHVASYKMGP